MPTSKDFSVEDEAYLATIAAEPKMTMDEVGADIEEHGHVPVTNENMTQDPFTAKGSLANALDNCLSSETDLEETTFTRDNNNQNPDMSLENPTDDFRDQTRGEVEGVSDTPQNTYVPPPTSEPTVQQDSAVQVKDSLAEALDSIAMDAVGSTSNEDKEVIEEYSEETASYVPRKAPDIPESLGGDPNKADANGLVYITRTFKVDPSKYISNNYRPINTAQAGNQNPSNVTVKSEAVDITEEEKLSDLGSPEARESAKEPDEPTHKEEADAAKDANKEIKKDEKKAEDEISEKAVLDYATFIDGSSFLCLDEIDEIDYSQIAMDAGPKKKVTRENCATTFNQCRAKNPLYCRFHGPKLLEADIKTQIKATVGPGCVVGVTKDKNAKDKFTFRLTVGCPPAKRKLVEQIIDDYLTQKPGLSSSQAEMKKIGEAGGKETLTQEFEMDILRADKPPKKGTDSLAAVAIDLTKGYKDSGKVQPVVGETPSKIEKAANGGVAGKQQEPPEPTSSDGEEVPETEVETEKVAAETENETKPPSTEASISASEEAPSEQEPNGGMEVPPNENETEQQTETGAAESSSPVPSEQNEGKEETTQLAEEKPNEARSSEGEETSGESEGTVLPAPSTASEENADENPEDQGDAETVQEQVADAPKVTNQDSSIDSTVNLVGKDAIDILQWIEDAEKTATEARNVSESIDSALKDFKESGSGATCARAAALTAKEGAERSAGESKAVAEGGAALLKQKREEAFRQTEKKAKGEVMANVEDALSSMANSVFPEGSNADFVTEAAQDLVDSMDAKAKELGIDNFTPKSIEEIRGLVDAIRDSEEKMQGMVLSIGEAMKETGEDFQEEDVSFLGNGIKKATLDLTAKFAKLKGLVEDEIRQADEAAAVESSKKELGGSKESAPTKATKKGKDNPAKSALRKDADKRIAEIYKDWVEEDIPEWVGKLMDDETLEYLKLLEAASSNTSDDSSAFNRLTAFEDAHKGADEETKEDEVAEEKVEEKIPSAEEEAEQKSREALIAASRRMGLDAFKPESELRRMRSQLARMGMGNPRMLQKISDIDLVLADREKRKNQAPREGGTYVGDEMPKQAMDDKVAIVAEALLKALEV